MRQGDDQWFDIVRWVHFVMLNAEELNINKSNVDEQLKSDNPEIKRLLGTEQNYGEQFGLTKDWAYRMIKQVGNYAEVFDRNVGPGFAAQNHARAERAMDQGRHCSTGRRFAESSRVVGARAHRAAARGAARRPEISRHRLSDPAVSSDCARGRRGRAQRDENLARNRITSGFGFWTRPPASTSARR